MTDQPLLSVEHVSVSIGAIEIIDDVSLSLDRGQMIAVIGANGAGKTTLLRVISNVLPVTSGTITFEGVSTQSLSPHMLARRGLVHVPQGRQIIPNLTVEENLLIGAQRSELVGAEELRAGLQQEYDRFPVLKQRANLAGGSLSGGEQQMLAISRALMMRPKVLMLDEPSLGLAPQLVRAIVDALQRLSEQGIAIILVEQMAMMALKIADHAYVLRGGKVALSGPAAELRKKQALIESYLG